MGLASLGASEEDLEKLAAAYWYTFEVGLCKDIDGRRRILGGAVLSSLNESDIAMNCSSAKLVSLDLDLITSKEYRQSI
jgi:phenylalanine-4-hydroxylase